jgi:hypothetical protein
LELFNGVVNHVPIAVLRRTLLTLETGDGAPISISYGQPMVVLLIHSVVFHKLLVQVQDIGAW